MSERTHQRKRTSSVSAQSRARRASSSSTSLSISVPHGADPFESDKVETSSAATRRSPVPPFSSSFPSQTPPAAMSHRSIYQQPSTPVFTLESDGTAAAQSPPTRHQFLGDGSLQRAAGALPSRHASTRSGDYFSDEDKYPPGSRGHASSVRIPLLVDEQSRGGGGGMDFASSRSGPAAAGASSWFPGRARLHPVMLIPAFVVGVFCAMSGVFGPTMSRVASVSSTFVSLTLSHFPEPTETDTRVAALELCQHHRLISRLHDPQVGTSLPKSFVARPLLGQLPSPTTSARHSCAERAASYQRSHCQCDQGVGGEASEAKQDSRRGCPRVQAPTWQEASQGLR